MERGDGMERNCAVLTAPLPGTRLGTGTEPQEVAGQVASPSFPNVIPYSLGITEEECSQQGYTGLLPACPVCVSRAGVN